MRHPSAAIGSSYDPNAVVGLKFQGSQHVNFGGFWKASQSLGNSMLWEAWAAVDGTGGYLVSDGYGGSHSLLWSPSLGGNIWNGSASQSFSTPEGVPLGQIAHYAVGLGTDYVGATIIVAYINGLPVSYAPFSGTRTAPAGGGGELNLFVGGSDHIHFNGRLYQLRAYDQKHPAGVNNALVPFTPERSFIDQNGVSILPADRADFLADFTQPSRIIVDLSQGYHGGDSLGARIAHSGALYNPGGAYQYGRAVRPTAYPLATWESVTNHPFTLASAPPAALPARGLTPPSVPGGAYVFDSFSREDQTLAWQNAPSLGSTEGGSAGVATWVTELVGSDTSNVGAQWGIFNGRAVYLDGSMRRAVAYPNVNVPANMDVRASRYVNAANRGGICLAFRIQDRSNFLYAEFRYNESQGGLAAISKFSGGTFSSLASTGFALPKGTWTVFRVVANGSQIDVYGDAALLVSVSDASFSSATKAGLCYFGAGTGVGDSGHTMDRWDDFTVYAA